MLVSITGMVNAGTVNAFEKLRTSCANSRTVLRRSINLMQRIPAEIHHAVIRGTFDGLHRTKTSLSTAIFMAVLHEGNAQDLQNSVTSKLLRSDECTRPRKVLNSPLLTFSTLIKQRSARLSAEKHGVIYLS